MIEAAIHFRWAETASLVALVPADRFTTGSRLDGDQSGNDFGGLPNAVLTVQGSQKRRHNNGHARLTTARIQIWSRSHGWFREALEQAFENTNWAITIGSQVCTVIESRIENDYAIQEEDGTWQCVFDLELLSNITPVLEPPALEPEEE